jgi:hypothetical protein
VHSLLRVSTSFPSVGGRSIAHDATSFFIPILRRPSSISMER